MLLIFFCSELKMKGRNNLVMFTVPSHVFLKVLEENNE